MDVCQEGTFGLLHYSELSYIYIMNGINKLITANNIIYYIITKKKVLCIKMVHEGWGPLTTQRTKCKKRFVKLVSGL